MVFALNIWIHYLYRVHYTIYIDHKSLRHIINQPYMNIRQCRGLDIVKDYDYEILYHMGKLNVVAGALCHKSAKSSEREPCMRI